MPVIINGPGMLSIQLLILLFTIIQTIGVLIIIVKLNLSFKDIFSLASPIRKDNESTALVYNGN